MEFLVDSNGTLTAMGQCSKDTVLKLFTEFLALFYILSPTETTKQNAYDVPDYEVLVSFYIIIIKSLFNNYNNNKNYDSFKPKINEIKFIYKIFDLILNY